MKKPPYLVSIMLRALNMVARQGFEEKVFLFRLRATYLGTTQR
ncbi:hypothetical protein [Pediococcus inopinatus]|nr:hypothetical protein [Pediococcus inopinatus]